ncbi:transposase [Thioploca ingrica]|uniref:Transposase n=1 Tax=Thioploca ingrica TaxID=40754 RepID=A0A090AER9_9GAMM|nr:transposase [Thioploca ingrica]
MPRRFLLAWVAPDWLPQLPPHSVVVMDNATFHNRADIQPLFKPAGHVLEYLPAYSPDFNPIEPKWAQAKAIRKQKTVQLRNF